MRALFGKLESPAVTNLTATFSAGRADATPAVLPDLYRGEPVALAAKVGALSGTLKIKGLISNRPWVITLPLSGAAEGQGLSKLWARRKITDAEVARTMRTLTPDEADRILALALKHHLVTRLTSLVAVDQTPSRPDGERLTRADVPLNLPAGWEFDKVFGGEHSPVPAERRADLDPVHLAPVDKAYASVAVTYAKRSAGQAYRRRAVAQRRAAAEDRHRCRAAVLVWAHAPDGEPDPDVALATPPIRREVAIAMRQFSPCPPGEIMGGAKSPRHLATPPGAHAATANRLRARQLLRRRALARRCWDARDSRCEHAHHDGATSSAPRHRHPGRDHADAYWRHAL